MKEPTVRLHNMQTVGDLKPRPVWERFAEISSIPRCSRAEEEIRSFIIDRARKLDLTCNTDAAGNVVVRKPATRGREDSPAVVIQGHLDMVCEKNGDVAHDFKRDGIRLVREQEWIRAENTTLGADNGIAVAMMLALLESNVSSGPLECLFTVDEETGLTGAMELDPTLISGRLLLNLDSEDEGVVYIGCAGGCNTYISLPVVREAVRNAHGVRVTITGLQGGHSGVDIHEERGNSIVLGARLLSAIRSRHPELLLGDISGGGKHNALPREVQIDLVCPGRENFDFAALAYTCSELENTFRDELGERETDLALTVKELSVDATPSSILTPAVCTTLIQMLLALPHGVLGMSSAVPGMVETSTNLASIQLGGDTIQVLTSQRSSRDTLIDWAAERVTATACLAGATVRVAERYPAWTPDRQSALVTRVERTFEALFRKQCLVTVVHAGLECGVIRDRVGEMDMISFGPDIEGAHTPRERVHIVSTERTWNLLCAILEDL